MHCSLVCRAAWVYSGGLVVYSATVGALLRDDSMDLVVGVAPI